jgi:hypothetical protein
MNLILLFLFSFLSYSMPGALPPSGMNTAVAVANDIDGDSDLDLFVGSRSMPQYGINPPSFVLVNDGHGRFSSMDLLKTSLSDLGLVTSAVWANVAGDAEKELVITGEWMAPRMFSFAGKTITEIKTNLNELSGWWQTVAASDIDSYGNTDLVLGNIGENFYLQPTATTPVNMRLADYDNNGTVKKIITRTVNGKEVPVFLKRGLTNQIASLRKQNLKHDAYATRSVSELFQKPILEQSLKKTFTYRPSVILFNEGNGRFTIQKLPPKAQFSSIHALLCTDINNDGNTDIIAGGNSFNFQPQFSRLDASYGTVIINKGNRNFEYITPDASGVEQRGQIRDIKELSAKAGTYILFLQNNAHWALYKKRNKATNILKTP